MPNQEEIRGSATSGSAGLEFGAPDVSECEDRRVGRIRFPFPWLYIRDAYSSLSSSVSDAQATELRRRVSWVDRRG